MLTNQKAKLEKVTLEIFLLVIFIVVNEGYIYITPTNKIALIATYTWITMTIPALITAFTFARIYLSYNSKEKFISEYRLEYQVDESSMENKWKMLNIQKLLLMIFGTLVILVFILSSAISFAQQSFDLKIPSDWVKGFNFCAQGLLFMLKLLEKLILYYISNEHFEKGGQMR